MSNTKCCDICERPLTGDYIQVFFQSDSRSLFCGSVEGHIDCIVPRIKDKYLRFVEKHEEASV
jgi:hypothetical protein